MSTYKQPNKFHQPNYYYFDLYFRVLLRALLRVVLLLVLLKLSGKNMESHTPVAGQRVNCNHSQKQHIYRFNPLSHQPHGLLCYRQTLESFFFVFGNDFHRSSLSIACVWCVESNPNIFLHCRQPRTNHRVQMNNGWGEGKRSDNNNTVAQLPS